MNRRCAGNMVRLAKPDVQPGGPRAVRLVADRGRARPRSGDVLPVGPARLLRRALRSPAGRRRLVQQPVPGQVPVSRAVQTLAAADADGGKIRSEDTRTFDHKAALLGPGSSQTLQAHRVEALLSLALHLAVCVLPPLQQPEG